MLNMFIFLQLILYNLFKQMYTVQEIKKKAFNKLQQGGCLKNIQAQLKAQVLDIIQLESETNKNKLGFKYQHPLLPKLLKYQLTSLCLDLIQQFLQSFKFQYTLNVFKKQINRTDRQKRQDLANKFKIELSNPGNQAVLLSLVTQLNKGQIKILKQVKGKDQAKSEIQKPKQKEKQKQKQKEKQKQKQKEKEKGKDKQKQKENLAGNKKQPQPQIPKKQKKQQKEEPPKKKEPKTAADFLANLDKFQVTQKKPDRSVSAPPVQIKKEAPPPETGVNKIRGSSSIKTGNIGSFYGLVSNKPQNAVKDPYAYDLKPKNEVSSVKDPYSYDIKSKNNNPFSKTATNFSKNKNQDNQIEEELDQFQQSRDSNKSKKNPMFSSTEQGLQSMGYDQSVDSIAIQQYDYYETAKKKKK